MTKNIREQYETVGTVKIGEKEIQVLDIKLMSDERWNELAIENAIENYTKEFGYAPESPETACKWQRERVQNILREMGEVA